MSDSYLILDKSDQTVDLGRWVRLFDEPESLLGLCRQKPYKRTGRQLEKV